MAKIMLLEPDKQLGNTITKELTQAGHSCLPMQTLAEALGHVRAGEDMTAVLDTRLPYKETLELLVTLQDRSVPVLFLAWNEANSGHLRALYRRNCVVLSAPFDGPSLRKALEDLWSVSSRLLTLGDLQLDREKRTVTLKDAPLELTSQEYELLLALMESHGRAVSRDQLLKTAWGYQSAGETRTVDVHIQRLRRKLGPSCIETVYKTGYKLHVV